MAGRKKKVAQELETLSFDVAAGNNLQVRLKKISKQTGLSKPDLIQKWILQEESMIGIMSGGRKQAAKAEPAPKIARQTKQAQPKQKEKPAVKPRGRRQRTAAGGPENSEYRASLIARVDELKKEGMTFKQISDIFNKENVATVSGTGQWYPSSITWLLNHK